LKQGGVIKRFTVIIDPSKIGLKFKVKAHNIEKTSRGIDAILLHTRDCKISLVGKVIYVSE